MPEIRVSEPEPATLALAGSLVFDTASEALRHIRERMDKGRHDTLSLDGVTAVDSAGLACVLAIMATARRHGGSLHVTHVPDDLMALARVCEVESLLV
ncbi:MAG TPA: STAS domain-containing protein [Oleiagrimonas sp.]|nr:STAS domain-containing protein [Oleiagrimonas sp.]